MPVARLQLLLLLAVLGLLAAAVPAGAAPRSFIRISDERTRTWSAWVDRPAWVRQAPRRSGRKIALLRTRTWHGSDEVVLVLGEARVRGRSWSFIRFAGLGDRRGWVLTSALSEFRLRAKRLVLDRARLRLTLLRGSRVLFSTPVGIGAPGSPTPPGRYYIRERLGPFANTNSIYGALAFGTSDFSPYRTDWPGGGQVGIHGTNQPELIPGRISNGCVRLQNANVLRLGKLLRVGTPLLVK
jgi:L,D-transpeptidase catalytic domain